MSELLSRRRHGPRRLRELLARGTLLRAPGCFDALSARLVEQAGFDAIYMSGFATTAVLIGRPDAGLLTQSEMVGNAGRIVQAVDRPLIADADTGYGNPLNTIRTVQLFEQAGVAGIHLEDQVQPKKCGHAEGKEVVPAVQMVNKIRAAVRARSDPDFVIIARTDARAVEGLDAALERGRRYRGAGADMLFIEAPQSEAEVERIAGTFRDTPLVFNWVEGGKSPPLGLVRLRELGFALVIFPISTLLASARAMQDTLARLQTGGVPEVSGGEPMGFAEFTELIGFPEVHALEREFGRGEG